MKWFNALTTGLFDLLFWPLQVLGAAWALVVLSILAGIAMLWIFGRVSNQAAIRTIRDRIRGNLIAVRLFGDDLGLLLRLEGRLLRDNVVFLKYALVPLAILIVPTLVTLVQLNLRLGARPLAPGEAALVKVTLRDAAAIERALRLEAPDGVTVETPGVRVPALREVAWRIRSERPGEYRLRVQAGDEAVEKELLVGGGWGRTSARRTGQGVWSELLYPGEAPIRSSVFESFEVRYAPLDLELFGWAVDWLVLFFVLSILSGFAFRRLLGVEL